MFRKKTALLMFTMFILAVAISWALTCGIVWLICLCFGLKFKLLIGTGIWLVFCLINLSLKKK